MLQLLRGQMVLSMSKERKLKEIEMNKSSTITITSKDRPEPQKRMNLSSLTDYRIETMTINAEALTNMLFGIGKMDSEMLDLESVAIYDFLRFEEQD